MAVSVRKQMYRVNLVYNNGITRSVFLRAKSYPEAEKKALKQNPDATGTSRSPFPQI